MSKLIPCECGCETCEYEAPDEPCWGQINLVDWWDDEDDEYYIHACQGHYDKAAFNEQYKPEPQ